MRNSLVFIAALLCCACTGDFRFNITQTDGVVAFSLRPKEYRKTIPCTSSFGVFDKKTQATLWNIQAKGACQRVISIEYGKVPADFVETVPAKPLSKGVQYGAGWVIQAKTGIEIFVKS